MAPAAITAALLAAASWAVASIAISRLLAHGRVTPAAANLFKNGLAATSFFVAALLLGGRWPVGADWVWLFLSGVLGFTIADSLYFAAFRRCGVQTAATIILLNVPIAALLSVPIAGDEVRSSALPPMGLVLLGVLLCILDPASRGGSRGAEVPPRSLKTYFSGVAVALCAAFAIGLAVPIGRDHSGDVGVCPSAFIRLAGGAIGAVPVAALIGLRARSSPSREVGLLIEPLFRAPGPASVWGKVALFGVGTAVLGLAPYHYALRELPPYISAMLFASTPLFTLPMALIVRERIGFLSVVGAILGFIGVAGIFMDRGAVERLDGQIPRVTFEYIDAPAGSRYPSFVEGVPLDQMEARPEAEGEGRGHGLFPPIIAFVEGEGGAGQEPPRLVLVGYPSGGGPQVRDLVEGIGDPNPRGRLFVHFADTPRAARLVSGGLVTAHLENLPAPEESPLATGVRLGLAEGGPPGRDLGWLHADRSASEHGFVSIVPDPRSSEAVIVWLQDGEPDPAEPGRMRVELRSRDLRADGSLGDEVVIDRSVSDSCPTDGVALDDGSVVIAFRDRVPTGELDVAVAVRDPAGAWTKPLVVNEDGWVFGGPIVNGPAIASDGDSLAVAWFLQLETGEPAIRVAFSADGGRSFGGVQTLEVGRTRGAVALAGIGGGVFVLAHHGVDPASGAEGVEASRGAWRAHLVAEGAEPSAPTRIADVVGGRRAGLLDLTSGPEGLVFAVWTGDAGLGAARIRMGQAPPDPGD